MTRIYDITPFTALDYPDELACIVWMSGCNFRCVYCHNPEIVFSKGQKEESELFDFLKKRISRLTGVVFSGGEATFCPTLPDLIRKTKAMGFKVKLDTNGSNPAMLRALIGDGLLDYVALDYKAPSPSLSRIVGTSVFEPAFCESLDLLIQQANAGNIKLEVRTTAAPALLDETDIGLIIADLDARGFRGTYWLQHIVSSGANTIGNIAPPAQALDKSLLPVPKNFALGFRNFPSEPGKNAEPKA